MGNPQKDPRKPETATATKDRPTNKKEVHKGQKAESIEGLRKKAEKVSSDPNVRAAKAIRQLRGDLEVNKTDAQQEGLTALNTAIVTVLTKLIKAGVDISKIDETGELKDAVNKSKIAGKIKLTLPEEVAVQNLNRIASESGPTATEIKTTWQDRIEAAQKAHKGSYEYYREKYPVAAPAVVILGSMGVAYLAYKAIKSLFGGKSDEKTEKGKEEKGKSWFKKKVMIPVILLLLGAGGFLAKDEIAKIMKEVGLDPVDVKDKVKKGEKLTKKIEDKLEKAGKKMRDKIREKTGLPPVAAEDEESEPGTLQAEVDVERRKEVAVEFDGERLTPEEIAKKRRAEIVTQALVNLYCINAKKFKKIKPDIVVAFTFLNKLKVGKINDAYEKAKNKRSEEISPGELGLSDKLGANKVALYHSCAIISKVFQEANKINKIKVGRDATVEAFLSELGNDPALGISHKIQDEVAVNVTKLHITSFSELQSSAEKVFSTEVIKEVFSKKTKQFIEYLANKYKIDFNQLDKGEKASFLSTVAALYGKGIKINQPDAAIDEIAGFAALTPKVKKVSKDFFKALKADVTVLLPKCIERYDMKREDKKGYDQVLKKYLKLDILRFDDALQMALLSDGIHFDEPSDAKSVGQAKDITMLYLMVHILKKREKKQGYSRYLSNLIELGSKSSIPNINLHLKVLRPYFQQLFEMLYESTVELLEQKYWMVYGLSDTHYAKNKAEILARETPGEFALDFARSGFRAAVGIPDDVGRVVTGYFPDAMNPQTTAEEFLKMVVSLGGTIDFPVGKQIAGGLYLFGKYYFIRPLGTTVWDSLAAALQKGPGVAAKTYLIGSSPFIIIGAASGALRAAAIHHSPGRAALGGLWGVGKGLLSPITMPVAAGRHVRSVVRGARYLRNMPGDVVNFERSSDLFLHYSTMVFNESSGTIDILKAGSPLHQGRKIIWGDIYDKMRLTWAEKSAINYNGFYGLKPEAKQIKGMVPKGGETTFKPISIKDKALYSDQEFINKMERLRDVLNKLRTIEDMDKIKTEAELFAKFKELGLTEIEQNTLRAKMNKPEWGFEKFKKHLIEELNKESKPRLINKMKEFFRRKAADTEPTTAKATEPTAPKAKPQAKAPTATVENLKNGNFRYKGEEFEITSREIKNRRKQLQRKHGGGKGRKGRSARGSVSRNAAIRDICEQRWKALGLPEPVPTTTPLASQSVAGDAAKAPKAPSTADDAIPGRLERAKAKIKRGWEHVKGNTIHSLGGPEAALEKFSNDLKDIQKQTAEALKKMQEIDEARKAGTLDDLSKVEESYKKAKEVVDNGRRAETELQTTIKAAQKIKNAEEALEAAKVTKNTVADIAKLQNQLREATLAAEDAMKTSEQAMEALSFFGKAGKVGKVLWRIGGTILALGGFALSGYEAIHGTWEAASTDVEGRSMVKGLEAGMWAVNTVADGAAFAVMLGAAETGAVGAASALALPLAPLTYAGSTIAETAYEGTKTDYEWAQEVETDPYKALHHFYTSVNSVSLGDAWIGGGKAMFRSPVQLGMSLLMGVPTKNSDFGFETKGQKEAWDKSYQESLKTKVGTMHKIYRGMIAIQTDPKLLSYIKTTPPSKEKNKEVEKRIASAYTINHEFYFRNMNMTGVQNYASAQKFIQDAQTFDTIMKLRDKAKKQGQEFVIVGNDKQHPFSLHKDRYDIVGGMDNPQGKVNYNPTHVIQAYKETLVRNFEKDPIRKGNLDRMDSAYLIKLFLQTKLALADDPNIAKYDGLRRNLKQQTAEIAGYLQAARGINLGLVKWPDYREPRWNLETLAKHLGGIETISNKAYLDFEKEQYKMTPALNALYKLGEYFGYTGIPNEKGLKDFFNEKAGSYHGLYKGLKDFFNEKAGSYHGLYWDGSCWYLHARAKLMDEKLSPTLSTHMVQNMIKLMRKYPNEMLKHRSDTLVQSAYDYTGEVLKMANILENGLGEGGKRGYQRNAEELKQEVIGAPTKFNPKKIEYTQEKAPLMADFGKTIEHVKQACAWSKLDYKVIDENTIELSRSDSPSKITLHRKGNEWSVGDLYERRSLMQAIVLGNLKNKVEHIIRSNKHEGATKRPFSTDNGSVDFDRNWNPVDLRILDKGTGWLSFYDEVGVTPNQVAAMLNNWFEKDGPKG